MINYKRNAQAWGLGIIAILLGMILSVFVSIRLCMVDSFLKILCNQMDVSHMQVRKVTGDATLSAYIAMMLETPEIDEAGITNLMRDVKFREFMYEKMVDYREDLLAKTGTGSITFDEVRSLYYENEDHFNELLGYSLSEEDLERYQLTWWTLAITERSCVDYMRFDHQGLLTILMIILSPEMFLIEALIILGLAFVIWKKYKESFKGMGILGFSLWLVSGMDVLISMCNPLIRKLINGKLGIQGEMLNAFLQRFSLILLVMAVCFFLAGLGCNLLCLFEKKLAQRKVREQNRLRDRERVVVIKKSSARVQSLTSGKQEKSKVREAG